MKQKKNFGLLSLTLFVCAGFFVSCTSSKDISGNYIYFQSGIDTALAAKKERVVQVSDQLYIQVFSKTTNQEQAAIFNLANGADKAVAGNISNSSIQGYEVRLDGTIEMPLIGYIPVVGLTRYELEKALGEKLKDYVKSPLIIVRFLQFNINVMGEVRVPGIQKFSANRVTVIDALSAAGDLTDYGRRENITVIREQGGKRIYFPIDIRNRNLFTSPGYLLEPNDIVYVSPNYNKLKSMNVDPEAQRRTGLLFSIASTVIGVATLLITSFR